MYIRRNMSQVKRDYLFLKSCEIIVVGEWSVLLHTGSTMNHLCARQSATANTYVIPTEHSDGDNERLKLHLSRF